MRKLFRVLNYARFTPGRTAGAAVFHIVKVIIKHALRLFLLESAGVDVDVGSCINPSLVYTDSFMYARGNWEL